MSESQKMSLTLGRGAWTPGVEPGLAAGFTLLLSPEPGAGTQPHTLWGPAAQQVVCSAEACIED